MFTSSISMLCLSYLFAFEKKSALNKGTILSVVMTIKWKSNFLEMSNSIQPQHAVLLFWNKINSFPLHKWNVYFCLQPNVYKISNHILL